MGKTAIWTIFYSFFLFLFYNNVEKLCYGFAILSTGGGGGVEGMGRPGERS